MNCSGEHSCTTDAELSIEQLNELLPRLYHVAPLISKGVKQRLEIYINVVAFIITSLFGVVANVINIIVFRKQGLKDSISLGFFALSISDLVLVVMSLFTATCYAAKVISPESRIDFQSLHYVSSGSVRNVGYSVSTIITAFLSLERCICVILPFKVKFIFTRSRAAVILSCIIAVHVVCYAPFFASQGLRWQPSTTVNGTVMYKLRVYFTAHRPAIEKFNYIFLSIITPTVSQIIVTVCAIILINGLKSSSKFRKAVTGAIKTSTRDIPLKSPQEPSTVSEVRSSGEDGNNDVKLGIRDARLVRTMVFLVLILSMSNLPLLAILYAQILIPELNIGKPYQNMYSFCHSVVYVLSTITASVNVFVYYSNSVRYREVFKSVICLRNSKIS